MSLVISYNNVNKSLRVLFGQIGRLFCYVVLISNHSHETVTSSVRLILETCNKVPRKMQTEPSHVYPFINGNVQNGSGSVFAGTFACSSVYLRTVCLVLIRNISVFYGTSVY